MVYSRLTKFPELEPHHQIQFRITPRTLFLVVGAYLSAGDKISVFWAPQKGLAKILVLLSMFCKVMNNLNLFIFLSEIAWNFIDPVGRVFANGLADLGSIPGHVIPKTLKMVLDTALFNTQQYKVHIKSKVEQSRERSSALLYTSV